MIQLKFKIEIPKECFRRMISLRSISYGDVLKMYSKMVIPAKITEYGEETSPAHVVLGQELSTPRVCILRITDETYLDMKDEGLLYMDGMCAFVSKNEDNETVVWPLITNEVYVFFENPFELKSYSRFRNKCTEVKILERTAVSPDDTSVVQHDKGYRLFKVRKYCVIAKQDMVVSSLELSGEWHSTERMICDPMWLLRNEPHNLTYESPKQQPKSKNSCDYTRTNMGEIDA